MAMEVAAAPWLTEARKFVGLREIVGSRHEPKILQFFAEAGHPGIHDDETAWCAAFVGAMLRKAGYSSSGALNARSYLNFGTKLDRPTAGCVVVFKRGNSAWQGHVGFVQAVNADGSLMVLGGNQGNAVSVARFGTEGLLGYRWPLIRSAPAAKSKPKDAIVEKVKDVAKVGGPTISTGTVAYGVDQGWGAWEFFLAFLALAAVAGAAYGGYRWWKAWRVKHEGVAAVSEALSEDSQALEPSADDVAEAEAVDTSADALAAEIANKAKGAAACQSAVAEEMRKPEPALSAKKIKKTAKRKTAKRRAA